MPGWTLRGGIARGFKAPTLRQSIADYCMTTGGGSLVRGPLCGNPDLEPEVSTTKEIGLRYDGEGKLGFGVTLFHTNFKNKVVSRSEEHTSELQSLMRISYAVFCLKTKTKISYLDTKKI